MRPQPDPAPPALAILVVDDEPLVLREMARGLARGGLEVLTAHSAAEARRIVAGRHDLGVMVTDIRMPGGDGLTLASEVLRSLPDETALEVVLVTGHGTLEDAMSAVRAGAFDFIQKPFRMAELKEAVERAMGRAERRRATAAALAALAAMRRAPAGEAAERDAATGFATIVVLQRWLDGPGRATAAGLLRLDLRRLRVVSEQVGRAAAEELAQHFAARIRDAAPPGALLARLGPHEFAVAVAEIGAAPLAQLAAALHRATTGETELAGVAFTVEAGMGVAHGTTRGDAGLLAAAEAALFAAGEEGGVESFAPARHGRLLRRAELGRDLLGALAARRIGLRYQPIVSAATGALCAFEALSVWHHARHGTISPLEFVPLASELGVLPELDMAALQIAIAQLGDWTDSGFGDRRIYVNVAAPTLLHPGFAEQMLGRLRAAGLRPDAIGVEVTESHALAPDAAATMEALRAGGVPIAVDDFGTGHSGLARLASVPADVAKLDRSFATGDGIGARDPEFLRGIVGLLHARGLQVVAEGIETGEQLARVREAGCDYVQGFLIAPALDAVGAMQWLQADPGRAW
jgi:EAL domain-containing protein (putative c-di-GMP-specific phosphodiesterase class I)/FixJ family two-component response regulator